MATLVQMIRLLENPRAIQELVGQIAVDYARDRFDAQEFDGQAWPSRYQWQGSPVVNRAGLIADLAAGRSIPGRRFEGRKAGIDSGLTRDGIGYSISGPDTVVGVSPDRQEIASRLQFGGTSEQPLAEEIKRRLEKFITSTRGEPYAEKLEPLLDEETLETEMMPRPFLGMTRELEERIATAVADEVERMPSSLEEYAKELLGRMAGADPGQLGLDSGALGDLFGIELQ